MLLHKRLCHDKILIDARKLEVNIMKDGYIKDYVSGVEVKATPEEIQAVQPFEKILDRKSVV